MTRCAELPVCIAICGPLFSIDYNRAHARRVSRGQTGGDSSNQWCARASVSLYLCLTTDRAAPAGKHAWRMIQAIHKFISHTIDILVTSVEHKVSARTPMLSSVTDLSECNRPEYFERPELFYDRGLAEPDMELKNERTRGGVRVSEYEFRSETQSGHACNDVVTGRIFEARTMHGGAAAPALILMHGWREWGVHTPYHWLLGWILARCGVTCILMTQPYHGSRKPHGTADGDLMLNGDMEQTVGAFRQSVCDVRSLITWARARYSGPVGVSGFSLGGFITGLVLCTDSRIDFAIPIIAGGDLIRGMWDSRVARTIIRDFNTAGVTQDMAADAWRIITPSSFSPRLAPERIHYIAGLYDLLIPADNVERIAAQWGVTRVTWLPCGHVGIFLFARDMLNSMLGFVREACGETAPEQACEPAPAASHRNT